jgi:hypothetical protein
MYTITAPSRQGACLNYWLTTPACGNGDRPQLTAAAEAPSLYWRFEQVPGTTDQYYISSFGRAGCRSYLSVQGCGGSVGIDLWAAAGINQAFVLVPTCRTNEYNFKAVGRADACNDWMSIQGCGGDNFVDTWGAAGINQAFVVTP